MNASEMRTEIAKLEREIAEINDRWDDSDEQEQNYFSLVLPEMHMKLGDLRAQLESTKGQRNFRKFARAFRVEISAFGAESFDYQARNATAEKLRTRVYAAEKRAMNNGFDANAECETLLREIVSAVDACAKNCAFAREVATRRFSRPDTSHMTSTERAYHAELRATFR